jgi:hypothetical protein
MVLLCPNDLQEADSGIRTGHPIEDLQQHHGKVIALDIPDQHAPFPFVFIVHKRRVCRYRSFQTTNPNRVDSDVITWQDWVLDDGVFDNDRGNFRPDGPPVNRTIGFLLNCRSGRVSR